jgi:N-methylhydantoinase B
MKSDPVLLEILSNRLRGVANEMSYTIHRTSFSVFIKETQDFVGGLTTAEGEVFSFPDHAPTQLLGSNPKAAIAYVKDYNPGDIVLANDPHTTDGLMTHNNDLNLIKPVFWKGELLFFLWDFLHLSDIGGAVPGSVTSSNRDIFQEGLRIPPTKLYREGRLNQELLDIFLTNTRTPELNWGDLKALTAALNCGERRVAQTLEKYGAQVVRQGVLDLLSYGERKARALIDSFPHGSWRMTDYLEMPHLPERPVRISLAITIEGSEICMDFTGTDPQVPYAFNLTTGGRAHGDIVYGIVNLMRTADPTIPLNAGILRPIRAVIPRGTLLNPEGRPAIGTRMAVVSRVMDMVNGAISQALPHLPPAGGGDMTLIFLAVPQDEKSGGTVTLLEPLPGGFGARAEKDGVDGVDAGNTWCKNVPAEVLEAALPILIREYHLDGAISAGKYRGGRGTVFEFEALRPNCQVIARNRSRLQFRPWGRLGGEPGGQSRVWLNPGTQRECAYEVLRDVIELQQGEVLRFASSCGGGYGDPLEREPALVLKDVEEGVLSLKAAESDFGVVMDHGAVAVDRTAELRTALRGVRGALPEFSYGIERALFEAGRQSDLSEMVTRLEGLPVWLRHDAQQLLIEELLARYRADDRLSVEAVAEIWQAVSRRLHAPPARSPERT